MRMNVWIQILKRWEMPLVQEALKIDLRETISHSRSEKNLGFGAPFPSYLVALVGRMWWTCASFDDAGER
jgi:hypothetical protein